jgi:hypothetical protein
MPLARSGTAIAVTPPRWCGQRADLLELAELGLSSRLGTAHFARDCHAASNFARPLAGFAQVFINRAPQMGTNSAGSFFASRRPSGGPD